MIVRVHHSIAALKSKDCRRLDPRLQTASVEDTGRFLASVQVKLDSTPRLVKKRTPTSSTWNFFATRQMGATRAHNHGD